MKGLLFGVFVILAAAQIAPVVADESLSAGDTIDAFTINDQHDKPFVVDEGTRLLMFSRDMGANKLAKKAFLKRPGDYLPQHHAAYLIDVSGMPKFVTRNFAVPKMRKYPYRILLDKDATLTTTLPSQKKRITLVRLEGLKITAIDYADSPEELTKAVETAAP